MNYERRQIVNVRGGVNPRAVSIPRSGSWRHGSGPTRLQRRGSTSTDMRVRKREKMWKSQAHTRKRRGRGKAKRESERTSHLQIGKRVQGEDA